MYDLQHQHVLMEHEAAPDAMRVTLVVTSYEHSANWLLSRRLHQGSQYQTGCSTEQPDLGIGLGGGGNGGGFCNSNCLSGSIHSHIDMTTDMPKRAGYELLRYALHTFGHPGSTLAMLTVKLPRLSKTCTKQRKSE